MEGLKCPNKEHNLFCMTAEMLKVLGMAVMRKRRECQNNQAGGRGASQEAVG